MRFHYSLLSSGLRRQWVDIPLSMADRDLGTVRVQLQEVPRDIFEGLALRLETLERALLDLDLEAAKRRTELETADTVEARVLRQKTVYGELKEKREELVKEKRQVEEELVARGLADHKAEDFIAEIPKDLSFEERKEAGGYLLDLGFTEEEVSQAIEQGRAPKRFQDALWPSEREKAQRGASPAMISFYARCQPDAHFLYILRLFVHRFQFAEVLTPEKIWKNFEETRARANGHAEGDLLPLG